MESRDPQVIRHERLRAQLPFPDWGMFFVECLIQQIPVSDVPEADREIGCPICMLPYLEGEELEHPVRMPCGHIFGQTCITSWFNDIYPPLPATDGERRNTCPSCRVVMYLHAPPPRTQFSMEPFLPQDDMSVLYRYAGLFIDGYMERWRTEFGETADAHSLVTEYNNLDYPLECVLATMDLLVGLRFDLWNEYEGGTLLLLADTFILGLVSARTEVHALIMLSDLQERRGAIAAVVPPMLAELESWSLPTRSLPPVIADGQGRPGIIVPQHYRERVEERYMPSSIFYRLMDTADQLESVNNDAQERVVAIMVAIETANYVSRHLLRSSNRTPEDGAA